LKDEKPEVLNLGRGKADPLCCPTALSAVYAFKGVAPISE
jgi:hypothetical protein